MTEYIDAAIKLMEGGFCHGDLKSKDAATGKDTYCAVGAVAEAAGMLTFFEDEHGDPITKWDEHDAYYEVDEDVTYAKFDTLPEAKVLADLIMETEWFDQKSKDESERGKRRFNTLIGWYNSKQYDGVVFSYNDEHSKEDVIALFKQAKAVMENANMQQVQENKA